MRKLNNSLRIIKCHRVLEKESGMVLEKMLFRFFFDGAGYIKLSTEESNNNGLEWYIALYGSPH